jgi:uncharacterized protein involved in exopolysaccharide biosynthesis
MALDVQIAQLRSRFGANSNRMRELQKSRAVLSSRIDHYMKEGSGRLIIALDSAPELGVEYAHLYRDVKVQEMLYTLVLQMYEQAKFTEVNNAPVVKVLEYAQIPQKKRKPKRAVLCVLWFFMALVCVCTYVVGDRWYRLQREENTELYRKLQRMAFLVKRWR